MLKKVVIIGSGNLAWHLAHALYNSGIDILQIYSRNIEHALELSNKVKAKACNNYKNLNSNADAYFLALADDVQESFAKEFPFSDKILIHTSGSLPMDILNNSSNKSGVFYPLQTFSKHIPLDFSKIPICIEASLKEIEDELVNLAETINCKWHIINSEKRKALHLAAVFACNFSNHMIAISEHILESEKIPPEIIYPLLKQTIDKIPNHSASTSQTGPANRNDIKIMQEHISLLNSNFIDLSELYKTISSSIFEFQNKDNKNNDTR